MSATNTASLWPVLSFTAAYLAAAIAGAILSGNGEFVFYLVVMAILIAVIFVVHRRIQIPPALLWALSVWGLLHMAGGLLKIPTSWTFEPPNPVLYSWWIVPKLLKYDQLVHAYGFGVTTWLCFHGWRSILRQAGQRLQPSFGVLTLCVAAGMGFGALNEIIEFIAVLSLPNTNVGGYINTGWDLIANAIGGVIAAIWIRLQVGHTDFEET